MSEPSVPPPPAAGSNDKTLMLVLAYLFPLSLIPLLTEKEDRNVQWHAKHGIVLGVAWAIIWVVYLVQAYTAVGLGIIIGLGAMIVTIMAIAKAVNGQRFLIPGLSDYADKF